MGGILIVAPHADDEVIGCGGMIAKASAQNEIHLVIFALWHPHHQAPVFVRKDELKNSCRILGIKKWQVLYPDKSGYLDTMPMFDMVGEMDRIIEDGQYDAVYFPARCHMHDHSIVHDACRGALRPGAHNVGLIATYDHTWPGWSQQPDTGKMYVDITDTIVHKMGAMCCYKSQLARHGPMHPVSLWAIRSLAIARGLECGRRYAELYHMLRRDTDGT